MINALAHYTVAAIKEWNPFGPEAIERRERNKTYRRVKRKVRKGEALTVDEYELLQTTKERVMALDLGTRTSTNAFVGGTFLTQLYVQLVELIPGMGDIEAFLLQPESIAFAGVLIAAVIARFSKTPAEPGKL